MDDNSIGQFNKDVASHGSYIYNEGRLSSELASRRTNDEIEKNCSFEGKKILDLGCGDGRYSFYLASKFPVKYVVGIDPADEVIRMNIEKTKSLGLGDKVSFQVGDVYNLEIGDHFDLVVMRWMMHHLPDPELAIKKAAPLGDMLIIVDPNGWNPVLKYNEHFSKYHIEHGEKSFVLKNVVKWLDRAGYDVRFKKYINLVPMFCPDWMAKICKIFEPIAETIPLVRNICCGQFIIVAEARNGAKK